MDTFFTIDLGTKSVFRPQLPTPAEIENSASASFRGRSRGEDRHRDRVAATFVGLPAAAGRLDIRHRDFNVISPVFAENCGRFIGQLPDAGGK